MSANTNGRFLRAAPARNSEHDVTLDEIRAAIVTIWGEAGEWVCDEFDQHSNAYFGGRLVLRPILFGLTPHGHNWGLYHWGEPGHITLHTSLLMPKGRAWGLAARMGVRQASDVLLHEMVHASVYEVHKARHADSHNNGTWCGEIVRITPLLGLPPIQAKPIRQKRIDKQVTWYTEPGHLTRADIAHWPDSVRPPGYYDLPGAML